MQSDEQKHTLVIFTRNGSVKKVTIPARAKVTLGHFAPGAAPRSTDDTRTLRVYLTKEQQVALIPGVEWFFVEEVVNVADRGITKDGNVEWREERGEDINRDVLEALGVTEKREKEWMR